MGVLYNEIEQKKFFKEFSSLLSFGLFPTYQKIFRLKVRLKYPVKYSGTPPSSLSPPFFTMEGGGKTQYYTGLLQCLETSIMILEKNSMIGGRKQCIKTIDFNHR